VRHRCQRLARRGAPTGYLLHLHDDAEASRQAAELVALDPRCCAFLTMSPHGNEHSSDWMLAVGRREGAKAFFAAELGLLGVQRDTAG
jgi:hypothetical protein